MWIMIIAGMDCSIRDCAVVDYNGEIIVSKKTNLSLSSDINDYIQMGYEIGQQINDSEVDKLYIDYTFNVFKARKKQTALNSMLIAIISAFSRAKVEFVSPMKVRKCFGLLSKAKKQDVWLAANFDQSLFTTEHEKDAYCLALYGVKQ
jgi:hypothetical protein